MSIKAKASRCIGSVSPKLKCPLLTSGGVVTEGSITLSHAELDRVSVIRSIISRRLTPAQAAPRLQLSVRQVQRLTRTYRTCAAAGRASTHRGRGPGNALLPPPAVILGTLVAPAEGGTTGVSGIQRNKGNHLSTPAKHQQGLAGEKRLRLPSGTRRAMLPPPAVILGTLVVPAEGGTTGVSGIQRNKGNHLGTPAKHQQGLAGEKRLRLPSGTRRAMLPPPAVILGTSGVPAEGGTTGVSGIQRNKGNHLGTPAKHQQGLTGEKRLRLPPGTRRKMTG